MFFKSNLHVRSGKNVETGQIINGIPFRGDRKRFRSLCVEHKHSEVTSVVGSKRSDVMSSDSEGQSES